MTTEPVNQQPTTGLNTPAYVKEMMDTIYCFDLTNWDEFDAELFENSFKTDPFAVTWGKLCNADAFYLYSGDWAATWDIVEAVNGILERHSIPNRLVTNYTMIENVEDVVKVQDVIATTRNLLEQNGVAGELNIDDDDYAMLEANDFLEEHDIPNRFINRHAMVEKADSIVDVMEYAVGKYGQESGYSLLSFWKPSTCEDEQDSDYESDNDYYEEEKQETDSVDTDEKKRKRQKHSDLPVAKVSKTE